MPHAILAATEAPAEFSAVHLANFMTLCTQSVEVHGLSLERCFGVFHVLVSTSFGQTVDIDRLSADLVKLLDEKTTQQLVSLHVNGVQFGLAGCMGNVDTLPYFRPPTQPKEERGPSLVAAYQNMKKLRVFMVTNRKQKVPVSPTLFVSKKDELGLEKIDDEGNPVMRPIIHLPAKAYAKSGGHGGKNAKAGSVNDFMVKSKARVNDITLPTQQDVLVDRVRMSVDYPGVRSLMSKEDLSCYYSVFKIYATDSMVLVSGVCLARKAFESEIQGGLESQLDPSEKSVLILVFSLFGIFGAQLMPHVAHTPATEVAHLTKLHYPNKIWMNGTRPFLNRVYVDDFFRVEAALGDVCARPSSVTEGYFSKF